MWNRRNRPRGRKSRASPILRGPSPSGSKGPQGPHSGVRVITVTHSASTAPVASLPSLGGERLVMQSLSCGLCSVTPVQWMNTSFMEYPAPTGGVRWPRAQAGHRTEQVGVGLHPLPSESPRAYRTAPLGFLVHQMGAQPPSYGGHRTGREAAAGVPCAPACPCDSQGAGSGLDIGQEEVRVQLQAVVRGP